jgi:glutathione peroxidase
MPQSELYAIHAKSITGQDVPLRDYAGKALLVVNVASKCGFTPQYTGLENLHRKYKDRGFAVLGFPCNQFGKQESGSEAEIQSFCDLTFKVSFPMFAKVEVNGPQAHPLYQFLKKEKRGFLGLPGIKWNFTKFLIDPTGKVIGRFAPTVKPEDLEGAVEKALAKA